MPTIGTVSRPAYVYDQETDTWVPVGVGPHTHDNFITATTIDAKGDLLVGLSPDTVDRLGIGANGTFLVADSTQTLGMAWRNIITPANASTVPLIVRGTTSQTVDIFDVQDSNNADLLSVKSNGNVTIGTSTAAAILTVQSAGTSTTVGGNVVARFQSNATGRDATIQLSDNVSNSSTISMLSGATIFRQNGVESMRIDSSGNVGINTTPGLARFAIVGPSGGTALTLTDNVNSTFSIKTEAPGNLLTQEVFGGATMRWVTNSVERMRINPSGNVSIGTTSADGALYISGPNAQTDLNIQAFGDASKKMTIQADNNVLRFYSRWTGGTGGLMAFHVGQPVAERMSINELGMVSINNSPPSANPSLRITTNNNVGTFNWVTSFMNPNLTATNNTIMLIGRNENARNSGYIGYRWVGDGSTSNAVTFGHFQADNLMNLDGSGNLLIGYLTSNGAFRLQVNSQIFATSSTIATSDGKFKENIETINSGLEIIDLLRPVSFDWKEHPVHNFPEGKTVGFIAQEVQESLKDYDWVDNLIKTNITPAELDEDGNEIRAEEEFLGIAEGNLIPILVSAIKELKERVEALESQLQT